jgi:hypothetical protein
MSGHAASWATLILLGAFHGINPAMGWLFAVALGLQEQRRSAVWRALLPLGLGHALAIFATLLAAIVLGLTVPPHYFRSLVAAILILLGVRWWFRHPHPRWVGMRVGMADLTLWSFLVASVHGAGLMVLPVFLHMTIVANASSAHTHPGYGTPAAAGIATALHAAAYLAFTGAIALLVFEKLGLAMLRTAWINLDLIWAAALVGTGAATLVM